MTSVKELGQTLKKHRSEGERDGAVPEEEIVLIPTGAAYAALMVIGGCLALGVGAFLASVLVVAPELAWIADNLQRMGITSGAVLAGGVTLLGLGLVCKAIARTHGSLSGTLRKESGLGAITDSQDELRDGLDKVQFELRVLHESTRQLLEIAHEQTIKRSSHHPDDAMLQLAASLDQLGARLEDRLETQHTGLERRLGTLDGAIDETRRRITKWLEEAQRAEREARSQNTGGPPTAAFSRGGKKALREPAPPTKDADLDELEVLVTLEDETPRPRRAPSEDDALMSATSLGLLDQLDGSSEESKSEPPAERPRMVPEPSEAKLQQLKSLLADQGLRQALEDLQREEPEAEA